MKKITAIIVMAAALAAVSCKKDVQPVGQPAGEMTLKAVCPTVSEGTRTYLQDGKTVVWAQNDAINVLTASNNEKYTLTGETGKETGTFEGNAVTGDAYALYPYNAAATFASGVITTTLPAVQNAKDKGFANNTNLAVAKEDEGTFAFKNVCGLIKFQIKGDNVAKVVITGNNNEDLAGKVNISFNTQGEPVYEVVEGEKSITIQTYNGAVMTPGTYYAAVLPKTFTKGITVTCVPFEYKTDNVILRAYLPRNLVKTGASALEVKRSGIAPIGYVDKGMAWDFFKESPGFSCGALRGSHKAIGCYMDLSKGFTFFPIGCYPYCEDIDLAYITNANNGCAPSAIFNAANYTNPTNLGKFGEGYTSADEIGNWSTRLQPKFCYIGATELSDEQYDALKTVADIKAIYTAHEDKAVNTYYTNPPDCVTNSNKTGDHKFMVIKTYSAKEGAGYGIFKHLAIGGTTWYIQFNYKWGLE